MYHQHPEIQFRTLKPTSPKSETQWGSLLEGLEGTHRVLLENLLKAQEKQRKYHGGMEITFKVGDRVWLLTRDMRTTRPSKKPNYNQAGLYTVSKTINNNTYNLDLPKTIRNHNVFHISLLNWYTPPTIGKPSSQPHTVIIDDSEEWKVDWTLDSKRCYRKLHYLVQWAGYTLIPMSWEPVADLENTRELVDEFRWKHLGKPHWDVEMGSVALLCYFPLSLPIGRCSSTNGIGTGFTTSRSWWIGGGLSLCAESAGRTPLAPPICDGICQFVYLGCLLLFWSCCSMYSILQPRSSAPKAGDNVTVEVLY